MDWTGYLAREVVSVPEWQRSVVVREPGAVAFLATVDAFRALPEGAARELETYVLLVAATARDDAGALLFPGEAGRAALRDQRLAVLERLAHAALRVIGGPAGSAPEGKAEAETPGPSHTGSLSSSG